jgi:hypothetical protein
MVSQVARIVATLAAQGSNIEIEYLAGQHRGLSLAGRLEIRAILWAELAEIVGQLLSQKLIREMAC